MPLRVKNKVFFVPLRLSALVLKNNSRREFIQEGGSIPIIYKFLLKKLRVFVPTLLRVKNFHLLLRPNKNFMKNILLFFSI